MGIHFVYSGVSKFQSGVNGSSGCGSVSYTHLDVYKRQVCDHILIIDRGKLIASDTPENLERQMAGAAGMELLVKGQEEEIREILEAIDGAEEIAVSESGQEGVRKVTFQLMGENCLEDGAEEAEREENEESEEREELSLIHI